MAWHRWPGAGRRILGLSYLIMASSGSVSFSRPPTLDHQKPFFCPDIAPAIIITQQASPSSLLDSERTLAKRSADQGGCTDNQ